MTRARQWLLFFSCVLVIFSPLGIDRVHGTAIEQEPRTLTVSEDGKVQVAPDKAVVTLSVETAGEALEGVQEENRENMKRVLERLQKLGIKPERMQTSSLSITPHYPPRSRQQSHQSTRPHIPKS